jgi:hypothetical protein
LGDVLTTNDPGTGTAQAYYTGSPYAQLAEEYGFIVIYPQSPYSGTCWDVSSQSALTHNGGGDSNSIANMVTWTISQYNANTGKVFVTGSSSGAMMTVIAHCLLGVSLYNIPADWYQRRTSWQPLTLSSSLRRQSTPALVRVVSTLPATKSMRGTAAVP